MEYQAKLNETHTLVFILFQVLKVLLKRYSYLQFFCFLLFSIRFYMKRYYFLQLFRTSFNTIWKKIFVTKLPFLQPILPNPRNPLNDQNQLSMTKFSFLLLFGCPTVNFQPLPTKQLPSPNVNDYVLLILTQKSSEAFETKVFCQYSLRRVTPL